MLSVGHVKYTPRYVSKRAGGYNVVYRTAVPDATASAANRGISRRLPSIDESQSAAIISETAPSASQKEKGEEVALLPEGAKISKSQSQKGRGQLKRQDADTKAAVPVQRVDSSEL